MKIKRHLSLAIASTLFALSTLSQPVHAAIFGFGDFSNFTVNQFDAGSPPTIPGPGAIQLTNGGNESRSIFANAPQSISKFTASFTYQATNVHNFGGGTGATFVLENDPRGAAAGSNQPPAGNPFGFGGIADSVGVTFDLYYNSTGLFTNGTVGVGEASVSPINLSSGDPIDVQLTYSGTQLIESLTDTVTLATFSKTYFVLTNFTTTVGASNAYVGVSAGGGDTANQFISHFQYKSVPEPSSVALLGLGSVGLLVCLRRRG